MRMIVEADAASLGVVNAVALVFENLRVAAPAPSALTAMEQWAADLRAQAPAILSRPEVLGYHELFSAMGYPRQVPAGERGLRLIVQRGLRFHNNVVDAYNLVGATFGSGLGLHDADQIQGDLYVRRARGTETITPLFKTTPKRVKPGDLLYCDRSRVVAWLGREDVDAEPFRVTEETTRALLVVLGNRRTERSYNTAIGERLCALLHLSCPSLAARFIEVEYQ